MPAAEGSGEFARDTIISGYKIVEIIGSGGGGDVYLAIDTKLDRKVALKFLPQVTGATGESRKWLLDEARAASRIKHPNIVSIYAFEEYGDRDFIVMEYIDGKSIKELASTGDLPFERHISIIIQIAEGLNAAHAAGIVHGDIKSDNILIDEDGTVKITDFGLAKFREYRDREKPEPVSGTIPYMSPEQTQGDPVDHRSDIFSMGVVTYELISGQLPFRGEFVASIIYSIVNDIPAPLNEYRDNIPDGLQEIVSKMLAKKPDDRYSDAMEIIDELERIRGLGKTEEIETERASWKRILLIAAVAVLAVMVLYWIFIPEDTEIPGKTIVVLPFDHQGDESGRIFSDGIPDAIRTGLARFGSLKVISKTTSDQYRETTKSLPEIAKELNSDYVLEGVSTWDISGYVDRVRINAYLIMAPEDVSLWTNEYIKIAEDILKLQSEIAYDVAFQVDSTILESDRLRLENTAPSNLKSYYSYLRGNYYFNRSWSEDDIRTAIDFYRDAVENDTGYAVAYSALSIGHSTMYSQYYDRSPARLKMARETAERSLELIPGLPEGHYAMGMYYYGVAVYDSAMIEFDTVRKNQPGNSDVYTAIAGVQRRLGDFNNAADNYKKAFELDPLSYLKAFDIGLTYGLSKRYTEAFTFLDNALDLAPDWPFPYIYKAWLVIFEKGDKDEALRIINYASTRTDLERSEYQEYYWWLSRIIDGDYQITLNRIKLESDTASYYLYKARVYRLMEKSDVQKAFCDSARIILEGKLIDSPDEARFISQLGLAYAGLGRNTEAVNMGMRGVSLAPMSREALYAQFLVTNLAEIYVVVGDYDSAVRQLKILLSMPGFASIPYLKLDPIWKPLYDHPGFRELISENQ
jgi:non-specific serine/threonine protein kinase